MGAGIILDGRLYSGTSDAAGEVGHIRLEQNGPMGYGKNGSFEGFCSGGGISQLGRTMARQVLQRGGKSLFCQTEQQLQTVTAQQIAEAADRGDHLALEIFEIVGRNLGKGLALLVDILNPEMIVIGSIYARQQKRLEPFVLEELRREALPDSAAVCHIVSAGLREQIGDYAALSVALHILS